MAAVLVVIYIPCDNDDSDDLTKDDTVLTEGKEESTLPTSSSQSSFKSTPDEPPVGTDLSKAVGEVENGSIVLAEKKGSEHLPLLEYAAESPVVQPAKPKSPTQEGDIPKPERHVRIAETPVEENREGEGKSSDISQEQTEEDEKKAEREMDSWSLEDALQDLLGRLNIDNDVWVRTDDETVLQVSFVIPIEEVDSVLRDLTGFGLGSIPHTSISTFPSTFHRHKIDVKPEDVEEDDDSKTQNKQGTVDDRSDFLKTIKSRLTVAQVVAAVEGNARATFDFIMLICLASFIAALGLVENSSVVLVASMLISPLMGPILGGVFGFVIQNRNLTSLGVKNALIGLLLCLVTGFLFGLAVAGVNNSGTAWGGSSAWPTEEMKSRGMTRSLWVGVLIALPSGAGVALSVLGGNVGSLVGVAISASLLPPAVNAGMLWAYSIISAIKPPEIVRISATSVPVVTTTMLMNITNTTDVNSTVPTPTVPIPTSAPEPFPPNCPVLHDNTYQFVYTCHMADEAAILGAVSLFLTILNIGCIFLMGVLVLKIKEVAPNTTVSPVTEVFWKKDLPVARDCYKTLKGKDSLDTARMAKDIASEWKKKHDHLSGKDLRKSWHFMLQNLEHSHSISDVAELQPTNAAPRRHTFMRTLSYQGRTLLDENSDDTPSPISSYHTPYSASSITPSHLRHRNVFFSDRPTPSPTFHTPPTSLNDVRFQNHLTVQRAHKPRVPRHMQRQHSLSSEIEKAVLKNLPTKQGRFLVSTIKEEEPEELAETEPSSRKGSAKTPPATAPFLLKLPEKKSPDTVMVDVEPQDEQLSAKERRARFFTEA